MSKLCHRLPPARRESGACWLVGLHRLIPEGVPVRVRLLEDGRPLGPPDSVHNDIRALGGGRYSFWNRALYFSTPDGSDPHANGRRYEIEVELAEDGVFDLPRILHVNITDACNLTCRMCREHNLNRSTLDDSTLAHLIETVMPSLTECRIDSTGEAVLHRRKLEMMMAAAARHGVKVFLSSNGTLIDAETADLIAGAGCPVHIQVSLDSPVKETFEWIRRGARFEDAIAGIRNLVAARDRLAAGRLQVSLHPALFDWNVDQTELTVRLGRELGVDYVVFQFGYTLDFLDPGHSLFWNQARHDRAIDAAERAGGEIGMVVESWGRFSDPVKANTEMEPCPYLQDWSFINANGMVAPCCISSTFPLGDVREQSFAGIWRGEAYSRLRETYDGPEPSNPKCSQCYLRTGWDRGDFRQYFSPTHWPAVEARIARGAEDGR